MTTVTHRPAGIRRRYGPALHRGLFLLLLLTQYTCSLWEYEDPSHPLDPQPPETFLTLLATDTIYARIDTLQLVVDPISGDTLWDTLWTYAIGSEPDTGLVWDTLTQAFTTVTSSKQLLHWWGEDRDGEIVGYRYKWNVDTAWTFTTGESGLFYVPIRTELDVFTFYVAAVDDDSLIDPTPARVVLPIENSPPAIDFRYRSNPQTADIQSDTSFTFPTRTFVWDVSDLDGVETITDVFYALDDTCDTCWQRLDAASYSSITLREIPPGFHTFYLKARDIAGAESAIARFPDPANPNEPNYWKVLPVVGDVLLIDDFVQDSQNKAQNWYRSVLDSILGTGQYSVWEIGKALPFSATDVIANLNYFKHVIWYTAYTGKETYLDASASILGYVMGGGNLFLNAAELKDTTFIWFPLDTSFVLNPSGRLLSGRTLVSQVSPELDLTTSRLIAIRVKGFDPDSTQFAQVESLYRLTEPGGGDEWDGTPNVCSLGRFQASPTQLSGKIVLMSIPLHNGSAPVLEGNGSAGKFIAYLLQEVFPE
jgi:hypothetical protein